MLLEIVSEVIKTPPVAITTHDHHHHRCLIYWNAETESLPYLCMYTLKLKLTKAGIYTLLTSYKTVPQHIDIFSVLLNWFNYGSQSRNRCSQEYIFVCPFLASGVCTRIYMAIVGHDGDAFSFADKIRNRALRLGFLWHDINTQAMICQTSEENWCQFIRHGTRNTELWLHLCRAIVTHDHIICLRKMWHEFSEILLCTDKCVFP